MIITVHYRHCRIISLIALTLTGLYGCAHPPHNADLSANLDTNYLDYVDIITECTTHPALEEIDSKRLESDQGAPKQYAKLNADEALLYTKLQTKVDKLGALWVMCYRVRDDPKHPMNMVSFEFYHSQLTMYGPYMDKGIEYMFLDEKGQKAFVKAQLDVPMQRKNWYFYGDRLDE